MNGAEKKFFGLDRSTGGWRKKGYLYEMWLYPSKHHPTSHCINCIIEEKYLWKINFDLFLLAIWNFYLQEHCEFEVWNTLTRWSKCLCYVFKKYSNVWIFCRNLRVRVHHPVKITVEHLTVQPKVGISQNIVCTKSFPLIINAYWRTNSTLFYFKEHWSLIWALSKREQKKQYFSKAKSKFVIFLRCERGVSAVLRPVGLLDSKK